VRKDDTKSCSTRELRVIKIGRESSRGMSLDEVKIKWRPKTRSGLLLFASFFLHNDDKTYTEETNGTEKCLRLIGRERKTRRASRVIKVYTA